MASQLKSADLRSTFIIVWCFNELCYVQADSGSPLEVSSFDLGVHCNGPIGTVDRPQLLSVCEDARQVLALCQRGVGSLLVTPLPRYLAASCCDLRSHCVGSSRLESAEQLCIDLRTMSTVVQRWVLEEGFNTTSVVCPHLELLRHLCVHPWAHWVPAIKRSFGSDPIHLTRAAYSQLAAGHMEESPGPLHHR